ncbi:MAG: hypothetical protein ACRDRZ_13005 [Pseudonocardiaceae bacterium]
MARAFEIRGDTLGADIALVLPGRHAMLIESKYGARDYVSRDGYHQVVTYAAEVAGHLTGKVTGLVVGPDAVVEHAAKIELVGATIGFIGPRHLVHAVRTGLGAPFA